MGETTSKLRKHLRQIILKWILDRVQLYGLEWLGAG
jgi:hypothetical protein